MTPTSLVLAALGTLAIALLLAPGASADAILSNGVVMLGVNDEGQLNVPGGPASSGTGTTFVGLRYVPTGAESTAPGCLCEGWGASYDGTVSGSANEAYGPPVGMALVSFANPAPDRAVSTVQIGQLRVVHDYHPSGDPNLFEGTITLENTGTTTVSDVRYRRVMDWDVEPTAFSEYVTLWAGSPPATDLVWSSDDGFASADPLTPHTSLYVVGPPAAGNVVDSGPADHGAFFEFAFGSLPAGARKSFSIFYGGAADEASALASLAAVNAEVWSLGQTSTDPARGSPNTFMFGFAGVGGTEDPCSGYVKRGRAATVLGTHEDVGGSGLVGPGSFFVHDTNLLATADSLYTANTVAGYSGPLAVADALHNAIDLEPCAAQAYTRAAHAETGSAVSAGPVVARAVESFSRTTCAGSVGWSSLAYLAVGSVVLVDGASAVPPNTVVTVGLATVVLNEQVPLPHGLEVNAARIVVPGAADVRIGHAASEIDPCGKVSPPCGTDDGRGGPLGGLVGIDLPKSCHPPPECDLGAIDPALCLDPCDVACDPDVCGVLAALVGDGCARPAPCHAWSGGVECGTPLRCDVFDFACFAVDGPPCWSYGLEYVRCELPPVYRPTNGLTAVPTPR